MYDPIAKKMPEIFALDEVWVDEEDEAPAEKSKASISVGTGTKAKTKPTRDDRRSRRYNVPKDRQPCELKSKDSAWPVLLVNESESGCAVLTDRLNGLQNADKVELRTDKGWVTFRVVYIKAAARPEYAPTKSDTWFRLGLKKANRFFKF